MSLVIDYDPDDLPAGYPDVWGQLTQRVIESRRRTGEPRVARAEPKTSVVTRARGEARKEKFYAALGPTDDWRENRRLYNRRRETR